MSDDAMRYKLPGVYTITGYTVVDSGIQPECMQASVWDVERAWADRDKDLIDPYVFAALTDAIEYIIRSPRKGGVEDLDKAISCLRSARGREERLMGMTDGSTGCAS